MAPVDFLLIEGFKKEDFPKIEICRKDTDNEALYKNDASVIAIATDREDIVTTLPLLNLNDAAEIADFIISRSSSKDQ